MLYHKFYDVNTTNIYLTVLFQKYCTFYIVDYILSYSMYVLGDEILYIAK